MRKIVVAGLVGLAFLAGGISTGGIEIPSRSVDPTLSFLSRDDQRRITELREDRVARELDRRLSSSQSDLERIYDVYDNWCKTGDKRCVK